MQEPETFVGNGFYEMGRHWIQGELCMEDLSDATFLNWRTGATRRGIDVLEADLDRRRFRLKASNLNAPYLGSTGARDLYCRERGERYILVLRHPRLVLQRGRGGCPGARLRRGVATWETRGHVHAYVLRTGRTYRFRGSDPEHTRDALAFVRRNGRVLCARLK